MSERDVLLEKLEQLWCALSDDLIELEDEKLTPIMRDQRRQRGLKILKEGDQIFRQLRSSGIERTDTVDRLNPL